MPISGVIIRCRTESAAELARTLARQDAVEIYEVLQDGSIVAVIEAASVEEEKEIVSGLAATAGVIDVQLAYHNFEDLQGD